MSLLSAPYHEPRPGPRLDGGDWVICGTFAVGIAFLALCMWQASVAATLTDAVRASLAGEGGGAAARVGMCI